MATSLTRAASASGSVLIQRANFAAASACWESVETPVEEPPQLPVTLSPAFHWGSGAMRHLPLVSGAEEISTPGAQTAETQARWVPLFSALFQGGVYIGWLSMTPSCTRPPQNSATFLVPASSMPTVHLPPASTVHHLPPACWARPANRPGSLEEKVVK